jgi:hypothetical protein
LLINTVYKVPMFFCGMHHAHDAAPNEPVDAVTRKERVPGFP